MTHQSGFLTGAGPQEEEKKTTAQINDEHTPEAMRQSSELSDRYNEEDDRPAIEQTIQHNEVQTAEHTGRNFAIDLDFEQEMHERTQKERAERKAKQEAAAKKEQQAHKKRKEEIAAELAKAQTLDDEELRDKIKAEIAKDNETKLYPDAKSFSSDVEDELWRKRADRNNQIAGRAKIEDVQNDDIQKAITYSFIMEAIGVLAILIAFFGRLSTNLQTVLYFVGAMAAIISGVLLFINGNKAKHHQVPSSQSAQFSAAAIAPGYILRNIFIIIFSQIPITGGLIGVIVGAAVGASIHYSFLNRYGIYVSIKDTLIMTVIYTAATTISLLFSSGGDSITLGVGMVFYIVGIIEYFLGDRAAMLLALYTNK